MIIWIAKDKDDSDELNVFTDLPEERKWIDGETSFFVNHNATITIEEKIIEALPVELKPGECIKFKIELRRIL